MICMSLLLLLENKWIGVIIFADHCIGYEITKYLIDLHYSGQIKLKGVFTNKNESAWWPSVKNLLSSTDLTLIIMKRNMYTHS